MVTSGFGRRARTVSALRGLFARVSCKRPSQRPEAALGDGQGDGAGRRRGAESLGEGGQVVVTGRRSSAIGKIRPHSQASSLGRRAQQFSLPLQAADLRPDRKQPVREVSCSLAPGERGAARSAAAATVRPSIRPASLPTTCQSCVSSFHRAGKLAASGDRNCFRPAHQRPPPMCPGSATPTF